MEIAAPDGKNLAQLMHATLTTTKQADKYRAAVQAGEEALRKYFDALQHSLSNRAAIHFDPDRPGLYAALKTFGNPQTAAGLKAASERILSHDIPPIPQTKPTDLTPEQQQLLARLGNRER